MATLINIIFFRISDQEIHTNKTVWIAFTVIPLLYIPLYYFFYTKQSPFLLLSPRKRPHFHSKTLLFPSITSLWCLSSTISDNPLHEMHAEWLLARGEAKSAIPAMGFKITWPGFGLLEIESEGDFGNFGRVSKEMGNKFPVSGQWAKTFWNCQRMFWRSRKGIT